MHGIQRLNSPQSVPDSSVIPTAVTVPNGDDSVRSDDQTTSSSAAVRSFKCVGCGTAILDQFVLHVAPNMEWHSSCLRCADCTRTLDETCTCFLRNGKIYCKDDYVRLFSTKCATCGERFGRSDLVMRAKNLIYHVDCFRCVVCDRRLVLGDEYSLRDDSLYCKADHDIIDRGVGVVRGERGGRAEEGCYDNISPSSPGNEASSDRCVNINNNNIKIGCSDSGSSHGSASPTPPPGLHGGRGLDGLTGSRSSDQQGNGRHSFGERVSGGRRSHHHHHHHQSKGDQKTTRIRTVLNEKQLHTLRTCYSANSRPDALMKEQLVEMTGLSPRVIRVWFQNKRCKDKKRSIALKQLHQQQQNKIDKYLDDSWIGQKGIPLIATSPVRLEPSPGLHSISPVDVEKYPTPWPADQLADLQASLHATLLQNHGLGGGGGGGGGNNNNNDRQTPFQHLINSFGDSFDDDSVVSFDEISDGGGGALVIQQNNGHQQQQQQQLLSGLTQMNAGLTSAGGQATGYVIDGGQLYR